MCCILKMAAKILENEKISRRTALAGLAGVLFGNSFVFGQEESDKTRQKQDNLEDYVGESIKDYASIATLDSLKTIGYQGGYFDSKEANCWRLETTFIPFYFDENLGENRIVIPSEEIIERALTNQVNKNFVDYLENLKEKGFNLSYSKPVSEVTLGEKKVDFTINLPIVLRKQRTVNGKESYIDERVDLKNHKVSHDFPLLDSLEIARYVVESRDKNPEVICISELTDLVREKDLHVGLYGYDKIKDFEGELIQITESKKEMENVKIYLQFLNKFKRKKNLAPTKLPGY